VVRDVVGHPTAPGSTWSVTDVDPTVRTKTMSVDRIEPCGSARCARVSAQYEVNPEAAARRALRSAAFFLARNGVNPAQAEVVDASLDYRDELLLEPGTLIDHAANFSQTARVTFVGAQGQFEGLDQANIRLARSLAGRGNVDVALIVDGRRSNLVSINIK